MREKAPESLGKSLTIIGLFVQVFDKFYLGSLNDSGKMLL